jgi:hypothetical protein
MRRLLFATVALLALAMPATADVILDPHLSGTGDNVILTASTVTLRSAGSTG